jgi:hypothetical protein
MANHASKIRNIIIIAHKHPHISPQSGSIYRLLGLSIFGALAPINCAPSNIGIYF